MMIVWCAQCVETQKPTQVSSGWKRITTESNCKEIFSSSLLVPTRFKSFLMNRLKGEASFPHEWDRGAWRWKKSTKRFKISRASSLLTSVLPYIQVSSRLPHRSRPPASQPPIHLCTRLCLIPHAAAATRQRRSCPRASSLIHFERSLAPCRHGHAASIRGQVPKGLPTPPAGVPQQPHLQYNEREGSLRTYFEGGAPRSVTTPGLL